MDGTIQAKTIENVTMHFHGADTPGPEKPRAADQAPEAVDFGGLLAKMCDRDIEDREFWNFFSQTCGACPNGWRR